ncbi:hypothetical protein D7T48_11845 [Stenotrophomonas maltophilia]|nr:hypothetical protein [Stenotrophomonas maltophilia]MBA0412958.1 hypothetical protein [Stenotrophomonas maltophilia]MBA0502770.1 hypothetical protein [Stenotrophomonas maltophilia]MBA0507671.1 hypothetical protein [Stenotrophomonas maltophilia]MBA0511609.1 hypothetical protein [Stenotrophomonas maltophilia]
MVEADDRQLDSCRINGNIDRENRMNLKVLLLSASIGLLVATAPVSVSAQTKPGVVTINSKSNYAPGSTEAQAVLEWVARQSPEYGPVLNGVSVEVVKKTTSKSARVSGAITAASAPGPPVPLPSNGNAGDEFTVTTRDRQGNTETWGYTFVGGANGGAGGWVLVEYHFKSVDFENQDSPETIGG